MLSYFSCDAHLYGELGPQLIARNNLKSDISALLAAHTENIFFNPVYFKTFIEKQGGAIEQLGSEVQYDLAQVDDNNEHVNIVSMTPNQYLNNEYEISLFGY